MNKSFYTSRCRIEILSCALLLRIKGVVVSMHMLQQGTDRVKWLGMQIGIRTTNLIGTPISSKGRDTGRLSLTRRTNFQRTNTAQFDSEDLISFL